METQPNVETLAQEELRSIGEILYIAKERGSPDLFNLSHSERMSVLDWYTNSELSESDRIDFLEEFMRYELIDDETTLEFIGAMTSEQKKQLGEYIGRTVIPGKYIQSFYECWPCIDHKVRQQFIESFTAIENPKDAIMVAPFVDLQKIKTEELDLQSVTRTSVLESEFCAIEDAKMLLDSLITYYEKHPDIQGYSEKTLSMMREGRTKNRRSRTFSHFYSTEASNIDDTINFYLNKRPYILYPYVERLCDFGFLSEEQVDDLFKSMPMHVRDQTKEEKEEIEKLTRKIKGSTDKDFDPYDIADGVPRKFALEIQDIEDNGEVRSTESILTNFVEHKRRFGFNQTEFLLELIDAGIPVFSKVELLGFNRGEVRALLLRAHSERGALFALKGYGDMRALLEWNRKEKNGEEVDLEKTVTDLIIKSITEGYDMNLLSRIDQILDWFEEDNKKQIVKSINQRAPHVWLYCLSYAIENQVMPFNELLERSSQQNIYFYLGNFNKILYHISVLKKGGEVLSVEVDTVIQTARNLVNENPECVLNKRFKYVIDQIFTEDELPVFIDNQLKRDPVDRLFLRTLISSDESDKYSGICKNILLSDPKLFSEIIVDVRLELIKKILSLKDIVDLLIQCAGMADFTKNIGHEMLLDLLESPKHLRRLLDVVEQSENTPALISVAKSFNAVKNGADNSMEYWRADIQSIEKRLKNLTILQASASASEKKEIQIQIDDVRANLLQLKHNKPKIRITGEMVELASLHADKLHETLLGSCESEKFLIFEEGMLDVLGVDATDIVRRDIEEYIDIHPEILLRHTAYSKRDEFGKLMFLGMLGEEEFARLFESKIRALSLWSNRYGQTIDLDVLPDGLSEKVKAFSPIVDILSNEHLQDDFYGVVLERMKNYQFYSLFSDRLEKIATEELSIYGPKTNMRDFEPKSEFLALTKIIILFEDSRLALDNKEAILAMSPAERGDILKMLEFIIFHHLDDNLDSKLIIEKPSDAKRQMAIPILEFSKKLFEIEDMEITTSEPMSVATIHALSTFYDQSCKANPRMKEAFREVVGHVLADDYIDWRAWGDDEKPKDEHEAELTLQKLKDEGLLPTNLSLEQYKKWLGDESVGFTETFTYQISDIQYGIRDILSMAVVDAHIDERTININSTVITNMREELLQPLRDLAKRQQELKRRMHLSKGDGGQVLTAEESNEYAELKEQIRDYRSLHESDIKRIDALRYIDQLRRVGLKELEQKNFSIDKKTISFADAFEIIEEVFSDNSDFLSDVRRIRELLAEGNKQIFFGSRVSKSELTMTDRVDLETYVLIGERPVQSCQHYDSTSGLNHGLLSYITDPAVRIGQIFDETGNIIARAIFRLMEDERGDPKLFLERVYSANAHPKINEAMVRFAIQKAKNMDIIVHTTENDGKEFTLEQEITRGQTILYSRGSRSPYTYSDAGGGKVSDGIFEIKVYS